MKDSFLSLAFYVALLLTFLVNRLLLLNIEDGLLGKTEHKQICIVDSILRNKELIIRVCD